MKEVLFKANDIRRVYLQDITPELFYHIGLALPTIIKSKKIAIGRDIRLSSSALFAELAEGLNDQGIDVLDLGLCDTPYTYYIAGKEKIPCLMITASHNTKEYNGLKIILPKVHTLTSKQMNTLTKEVRKANKKQNRKAGTIKTYDKKPEYAEHILKQIDKKHLAPLKIVIDCSNGMAQTIAPQLYHNTPAKVIYINEKPDGSFPAHAPNPAILNNLKDLQSAVIKEKADLGMMFDGDCDRVAFVDEKGKIIDSSIAASIFTHYFLEKEAKGKIVHTVTASRILHDTIKLYGGKPIVAKVGHKLMKDSMRKNKAIFGAEPTGHYYFKQNWEADSGMLASLLFYEIISKAKAPLSLIKKTFEKYYSLGETNYTVTNREEAFNKIKSFIKFCKPDWESQIDGYAASKKNENGDVAYATIRISNTENVVRLTVEATCKECAEQFKKGIDKILK